MTIRRLCAVILFTLLASFIAACDNPFAPKEIIEPVCYGSYITGIAYGHLDTLGIAWHSYPPFCKYPANPFEPNEYVK